MKKVFYDKQKVDKLLDRLNNLKKLNELTNGSYKEEYDSVLKELKSIVNNTIQSR